MAGRRRFTNEFKIQVVREYLSGMMNSAAVAPQYDIAPDRIKAWQRRDEEGKLTDQPGGDPGVYRRIAELERVVGQMTVEDDLLEKPTFRHARSQADVLPMRCSRWSSADPVPPGRMGVRGDRACSEQLSLATSGLAKARRR